MKEKKKESKVQSAAKTRRDPMEHDPIITDKVGDQRHVLDGKVWLQRFTMPT